MSRITALLETGVEEKVFSGATYLIGTKDKVLEKGCVGTLGTGRGSLQEDSLFDMASVTKPLVSIAFMKLLEAGKICLCDSVGRYLVDFRNSEKAGITMYELLTHTSVIPGQVQLYRSCSNKKEILDAIRYLPPRSVAEMPVMYSSQGMIVLGEVLCQVAGMPLDEVMRTYVFEPLGMEESCFCPSKSLKSRIASTEYCPWRGRMVIGEVHDENAYVMGGICGHAGIFSNICDMSRVGAAMLSDKYLSESLLVLMTKNHTKHLNLARGLGWQCKDPVGSPAGDLFSENSFGHTGFTGTSIWVDPYRELYAVLLTNRVHYSREPEGISHIRHIFHNLAILEAENKGGNRK